MTTLGNTLKQTRESISLTLRQVEDSTGISNAYLSQLENNKIKKPSANILYKLASAYKIDLNVLLGAAGIIQRKSDKENLDNNEWENRIAFFKEKLTEDQKKEVLEFIRFKLNNK